MRSARALKVLMPGGDKTGQSCMCDLCTYEAESFTLQSLFCVQNFVQ